MNTTIQSTLLDLCQQVIEDPDHIPIIPLDVWPEGTDQQHLLASFRDMLERLQQHYQDKLEAQERFSLAVEGANDGLWVQHLQTNEAYFSQRWKSMLGYEEDEISNSVDEWLLRLHPEDIDRVLEFGRANIAGEIDTYEIEYRLRHKDGSYRWVLSRATTLRDAGGKAYRLAGSNTDITERKLAEEQVREKEEQYRSIFEASTDALMIGDLEDGHIVEANPAACQMYGYSYEEFIGLGADAITPPDYQHLPGEARQTIKEGSWFQTRGVAMRKDGSTFYVEAHGTPFTYKGKPHQLASVRDITEGVQAEQRLREKEEQYRGVFEATYDGLVINDLDGFCVEANPTYCRLLGYTSEEMIGLHYSQTTFPEYYPVLDENSRAIRAGAQYQTQGLARRKDGSALPVEALSIPFTYKGEPHMLGVMRDITERVQAEQQLREKEEQYRSIFEATIDGLIISNLRGLIIEANPAACKMYGYTYEEFVGLHGTDITSQDTHFLLAEALQTIRTDSKSLSSIRATGLRKDDTMFPTEGYGTRIMYKGKPHILAVVRDITEQVRAEEQLREKEEQYRSIFEATTDGLIIRDMGGFVVEANPAAYTMHGYTYQEFIGLHRTNIIAPEDHSMVAEYMKAIQAGRTFRGQAVDLRKDGSAFPVEVRGSLFTYLGKPHTLSVLRDISERVQAEQQLREKEEQYRSIFEATTDGLYIQELENGRVVEVNPAACKMHGFSYEEFIGLLPLSFIHPDSFPLVTETLQTIQAGGQFHARGVALHKDGTSFSAEAYVSTFTYKGRPHLLSIVRDISEQLQAERQLREKEEQYRSIFEATNDGLDILDPDGFIVEANPAFCSMFGYTREELIGLYAGKLTAPQSRHLVEESRESIKEGRDIQVEGLALRKDGSVFQAEAHLTALIYHGKSHMLGVTRDITEQVQAQQLLEQRVEERTRELSTLLEVSHNVASTIELKPLLDLILDQLKAVVNYTGSSLTILEHEDLVLVGSRGPEPEEHLIQRRFSLKHLGLIWEMICRREPVIIDDVQDDTPLAQAYQEAVGELLQTTLQYVHSWIAVPLIVKERVIGMLGAGHSESKYYEPRHATLALAIANQAAIAIENARLYEQAQELAAVEERQRLARELHDSVSQALYGISLGVHTARLQVGHNPDELAESLDYVLELAEAALTEMRALIFELRPESLEAEGLVTALTKQAAALHARHGIKVELDLCGEPDVSLKVKRELYRVAQEALHNTVKHAEASRVDLRLRLGDGEVILEVRDDGKGFEATGSFPGHLGLHSMRERIESLDGGLQIESAPGQGTSIRAYIPTRKTTELMIGE